MKILALESYYGGSHKAFLDGLIRHSSHDWTLLTLPPNKWKWRMRHGAIYFAQVVSDRIANGESWDMLFCSDMLNLAEFIGLANPKIASLPKVIYFHENQLTYPVQVEDERDYQFAMTNITSCLAANQVWFNSAFHRDSFLTATEKFLKKMPDHQPFSAIETIREKSKILPPGIKPIAPPKHRKKGPLRILWNARWEHDKNPEDFFIAIQLLSKVTNDFRLSVIGESFRNRPEVFDWAQQSLATHFDHWGYLSSREEYEQALRDADVVVSTANHEFFGIAVLEAVAAGCVPLLPRRLAYPEIFDAAKNEHFFYDGTPENLSEKLLQYSKNKDFHPTTKLTEKYCWKNLAPHYDSAFSSLLNSYL